MVKSSAEIASNTSERPNAGVNVLQEFLAHKTGTKDVKNSLYWKDKSTDVKTDSIEDRGELRQPLEEKRQKNFLEKSVGTALAFLGFRSEEKLTDDLTVKQLTTDSVEVFTDETKLNELNNAAEKAKKTIETQEEKIEKIQNFLGMPKLETAKEKTDIYRQEDFAELDLIKKTWEDAAYKNKEKTQRRSWIGRAFIFVPMVLMQYGFFRTVKNLQKKGVLDKIDKLEAAASKAKNKIDKVTTTAKNTIDRTQQIGESIRSNKALNLIKLDQAKSTIIDFKSAVRANVNDLRAGKIKPKAMAKKLQGNLTNLFDTVKKGGFQKEFQHLIDKGKVPGIERIKKAQSVSAKGFGVGSIGVASAFNIAIFDAIQEGSFGAFTDSLLSKETLKLAFVPGVGTYQSVQRFRDGEAGIGFKVLDLGLNVVGDVILASSAVGALISGGTSLAAGYAARGGLVGLGKSMLTRSALKSAGKAALKSGKKALVLTGVSAPISIGIGTLMGAIDKEQIQDAFVKNVLTVEQQRSFKLVEN